MENRRVLSVITANICKYSRQLMNVDVDTSSSDDDDDDLLLIKFKRAEKAVRIQLYVQNVIPHYTESQFKMHFRVTSNTFENILAIVGPRLKNQLNNGRPTIEPKVQLLAIIWLMATPDSYRSVGDRFDLSKSSLHHCFIRVIHILNTIAPNIIQWPTNEYALRVKQGYSKTGIHNIIGAIDGAYIAIKAPKNDSEVYICRKKFYAITLQAVCDHKLKFTDCFAGYPSSVNDSRIFKNSDLYKGILQNRLQYFPNDEFIIGDKAYPVREWCIAPYINRGNLSARQIRFNTLISAVRQNIERAFALLKGRFRRLKYLDMSRVDLIPATILACCVLHNVCLINGDLDLQFLNEGFVEDNENENENDNQIQIFEENEAGTLRRDRIALNL